MFVSNRKRASITAPCAFAAYPSSVPPASSPPATPPAAQTPAPSSPRVPAARSRRPAAISPLPCSSPGTPSAAAPPGCSPTLTHSPSPSSALLTMYIRQVNTTLRIAHAAHSNRGTWMGSRREAHVRRFRPRPDPNARPLDNSHLRVRIPMRARPREIEPVATSLNVGSRELYPGRIPIFGRNCHGGGTGGRHICRHHVRVLMGRLRYRVAESTSTVGGRSQNV